MKKRWLAGLMKHVQKATSDNENVDAVCRHAQDDNNLLYNNINSDSVNQKAVARVKVTYSIIV